VPCAKVGARNGEPELAAWLRQTGLTGFYLRVLEPGAVAAGDAITLIERNDAGISVLELNRLIYVDTDDIAATERALDADGVLDWWRERLERNLARARRSGA
jgi:MOSC domain-containing protein YiiM